MFRLEMYSGTGMIILKTCLFSGKGGANAPNVVLLTNALDFFNLNKKFKLNFTQSFHTYCIYHKSVLNIFTIFDMSIA